VIGRLRPVPSLAGRRVLITGGARGIGAALARRLHDRGARVAVVGLEPEHLAAVAAACGDAPGAACDVADGAQVDTAVADVVARLGGLDVVVANAGIAAQFPLVAGDPAVLERTLAVNVMGVHHTLRAAAPHVSHPNGYALAVSSLAAAVHLPLLGAYSASKAAVEALGNTLRVELAPTGARVGVAYFAELDTDMTHRGFGTEAARVMTGGGSLTRTTALGVGIDAVERGIARRSRRVVAPWWVAAALPARMLVQPAIDRFACPRVADALRVAAAEHPDFTTPQPTGVPGSSPPQRVAP
jgi:NAD(P)-dependent dehydrogenase (short-subunit alcohol dehydrogenase family)